MRESLPCDWFVNLHNRIVSRFTLHNAHAFVVKPKTTSPPTARVYQRTHVDKYCVESHRSDPNSGEKLPQVDTVRKYLLLPNLLGFWTWLSLQTGWKYIPGQQVGPLDICFLGGGGIFINESVSRRSKIVGVVGDVRRDMEGHHYAEKCSVFGISAEELKVLHRCFKCKLPSSGRSLEL